jgi:cytochrome c-type biogenesis protein CcmH/NrfF
LLSFAGRPAASALAGLLFLLPATAALPASPQAVESVTGRIICDCGCSNLTIKECTCGKADRVRAEVTARLDSGQSPDQVVQTYVDEFGEQILAAPTTKGFNLVGWLAPFAALILAAAFLVMALRRWSKVPWQEAPLLTPTGPAGRRAPDPSFLKRVEDEIDDVER